MSERAVHLGRFGGIGLWLEAPRDPVGAPTDVLERAAGAVEAAEGAGIASVWVSASTEPPGVTTPYEAYSLLGALAVRSERVLLGVVVDGTERRAPSILAKIVSGIDVISHGRGVLALDGDPTVDSDGQRLAEALAVCRSVLVDEHPTYGGRIYTIQDAVNRPAPVQVGGVPVVVHLPGDGPGKSSLLELAARLADAVVVDGVAGGVVDACGAVADAGGGRLLPDPCAVLGRIDSASVVGSSAVAEAVDGVRSAGAAGCLVGLPYPWDPDVAAALARLW